MSFDPKLLPILNNLNTVVSDVYATRYITIISLTLTLYDAFTLLPDEIQYIWLARSSITKWVYLSNRYLSFVGMALLARGTGMLDWGQLSDGFCVGVMASGLALGALSIGVGNYLVLLKVWVLWDQRRLVIAITTAAWLVSYTTTLAIVGVSIAHLAPDMVSFAKHGLNVCGVLSKPDVLRGIWAAPIALEVVIFVFTVFNAIHRPRPANVSLSRSLYRDGMLFFLALFVLRVFNLVVIIMFRSSLQFIGSCLIWGVNSALLHRLILNQTQKSMMTITVDDIEAAEPNLYELHPGGDARKAYEARHERFASSGSTTPIPPSFFDTDAFNQPRRLTIPGGINVGRKKVTFATEPTFMDTARENTSLRALWADVWHAVGGNHSRLSGTTTTTTTITATRR